MSYNIYVRNNEHKIVKKGFSWPALFFNWIWFYFKGMIMLGLLFSILPLIFDIMYVNFTPLYIVSDLDILLSIASISIILIPGFCGNQWWEDHLMNTGWQYFSSVQTNSYLDAERKAEIMLDNLQRRTNK